MRISGQVLGAAVETRLGTPTAGVGVAWVNVQAVLPLGDSGVVGFLPPM